MPAPGNVGERLGKLALMLSSTHAGEVAAAAAAIGKVLQAEGTDWHQLAKVIERGFRPKAQPAPAPPPRRSRPKPPPPPSRAPRTPWAQAAMEVLRVGLKQLRKNENAFLTDLLKWRGEPTLAQQAWLRALCARFGVEVENG